MGIVEILNQYGFATLAAIAMGYFIYFIYNYVTTQIIEKLDNTMKVLIALIDRVRMLDNDIIRLRSKLNTVLEIRENERRREEWTTAASCVAIAISRTQQNRHSPVIIA